MKNFSLNPLAIRALTDRTSWLTLTPLVSGYDWLDVYWKTPVNPDIYDWLAKEAVITVGTDAVGRSRAWNTWGGDRAVVLRDHLGASMRVLNPRAERSPSDRTTPVSLSLEGTAWASGEGLSIIDMVERCLGLEREHAVAGRQDLFADVWFPPSTGNLHRSAVADGDVSIVREHWVTRSRRHELDVRIVGGHETPTLYLGSRSSGHMLRVYRKDVDYDGNTARLYHDRWTRAGWDGTGVVLRFEWEISREKLRHEIVGGVRGDTASLDWIIDHRSDLWQWCLDCHRWVPPAGIKTAKRRANRVWERLRDVDWSDDRPKKLPLALDRERLKQRSLRTLACLREACGDGAVETAAWSALNPSQWQIDYVRKTPWCGLHQAIRDGLSYPSRKKRKQK